jgi:hypothetical protein
MVIYTTVFLMALILALLYAIRLIERKNIKFAAQHPVVIELIEAGWKIGRKPGKYYLHIKARNPSFPN